MDESLPEIFHFELSNPEPNDNVLLYVLKDPKELLISAFGLGLLSPVFMLILAPNEAAPFVEVPTPRLPERR